MHPPKCDQSKILIFKRGSPNFAIIPTELTFSNVPSLKNITIVDVRIVLINLPKELVPCPKWVLPIFALICQCCQLIEKVANFWKHKISHFSAKLKVGNTAWQCYLENFFARFRLIKLLCVRVPALFANFFADFHSWFLQNVFTKNLSA